VSMMSDAGSNPAAVSSRPEPGPGLVLDVQLVCKRWGAVEVVRDVSLALREGERHALVGPNGAGKSTLFDLVSGRCAPCAGRILLRGEDITGQPPHLIRRRGLARSFQGSSVFPGLSVRDNLRCALLGLDRGRYALWRRIERTRAIDERVATMLDLARLGDRCSDPAGSLSHAEQRRLEIALAAMGGGSVLLLDEPTAGMSRAEAAQAIAFIDAVTGSRSLLLIEHDPRVVQGLADRVTVLLRGRVIATGTLAQVQADAGVRQIYAGARGAAASESELASGPA